MAYPISPRIPLIPSKFHSVFSLGRKQLNLAYRYYSPLPGQVYQGGFEDSEILEKYRPGGYHPLKLGDTLKDGRYKTLHKLGWGGHATLWAARDRKYDYLKDVNWETSYSNYFIGTAVTLQLRSLKPTQRGQTSSRYYKHCLS
jgi:hypothetical protein